MAQVQPVSSSAPSVQIPALEAQHAEVGGNGAKKQKEKKAKAQIESQHPLEVRWLLLIMSLSR